MGNVLAPFAYLCVGTLFGLAVMALLAAVARRRRVLDETLSKVYGPLQYLLGENVTARAKVAEIEKRLMETYAPESAPFSQDEKKGAAEAYLAAGGRLAGAVLIPNQDRMKEIVTAWGHFLDDGDYLALSDELARAAVRRALGDGALPKQLREPPPARDNEADILEPIRERFLALSAERRAGFFRSLIFGVKHLFT